MRGARSSARSAHREPRHGCRWVAGPNFLSHGCRRFPSMRSPTGASTRKSIADSPVRVTPKPGCRRTTAAAPPGPRLARPAHAASPSTPEGGCIPGSCWRNRDRSPKNSRGLPPGCVKPRNAPLLPPVPIQRGKPVMAGRVLEPAGAQARGTGDAESSALPAHRFERSTRKALLDTRKRRSRDLSCGDSRTAMHRTAIADIRRARGPYR